MFRSRSYREVDHLVADGLLAIGTVTGVRDTGTTVNDNPRVEMTFWVQPLDGGPAFEARKTRTVSRVEVPQPGQRYPVWFDPSEPSLFAYALVDTEVGRAQVVELFGDAFGADASGVGGCPVTGRPLREAAEALLLQLDLLHAAEIVDEREYVEQRARILAGR